MGSLKRLVRRVALFGVIIVLMMSGAVGIGRAGKGLTPGVSAGISAFGTSETVSSLGPELRADVELLATTNKVDVGHALRDLYVFRSGLGVERLTVLAFRNDNGSPCVIVPDLGGFCADTPSDGTPGLHWMVGGGTPSSPSSLIGVASDDVTGVQLVVDGNAIPVSLANNVVFGEFSSDALQATVTVKRRDGTQNSFEVDLDG